MTKPNKPNKGSVNRQEEDENKVANGGSSNEKKEVTKAANSLGGDILESLAEKPDSFLDLVEPLYERSVGMGVNTAIAFGLTDLSFQGLIGVAENANNLINDLIKELNAEGALNNEFCKAIAPEIVKEDLKPYSEPVDSVKGCLSKSSLYNSADGSIDIVSNIFSVVSELTKPADPAECINPYFDQFFDLVPVQFIISASIRKLIKEQLGNLTEQQIEATLREVSPCGQELSVAYSSSNPDILFPDMLPLFKLPKIPSIPNINLYTILHKLIVELICFVTCVALTKLIAWLSKEMLEFLNENFNEERVGGSGNFTEFIGDALGPFNLNDEITNEILFEAIIQNKVAGYIEAQKGLIGEPPSNAVLDRFGFHRKPTNKEKEAAALIVSIKIRKYFNALEKYESAPYKKQVFDPKQAKYVLKESTRKLGAKELIYMTFGEYTCLTMADLIEVGKREEFLALRLNSEKRIVEFFKFLGVDFDPIGAIDRLREKSCPPLPCDKLDKDTIEEVNKRLAELCKILNFKSGLPPIPINKILSSIGLGDLFNDGIKAQFDQLKTEQLFYLGFPSVGNYPSSTDLNPFPPPENNNLNDYELWTQQEVSNKKLFEEFLLRGGPPLQWKYDQYNLNKDLQGSTLEDVCGEEETFEETFIHIFNDVFELDYAKIQETTQQKQKDYKKQYEERVKFEYDRRAPTDADQNPCCKFKDVNFTITAEPGDDTFVAGPNAGDSDISILEQKVKDIYNQAKGAGSGTLGALGFTLTREQRCWICKRKNIFSQDSMSLLAYIDSDGGEGDDGKAFKQALNCKEFGYNKIDGFGPIKEGSLVSQEGKCPKV